jgi:hypothetical protein
MFQVFRFTERGSKKTPRLCNPSFDRVEWEEGLSIARVDKNSPQMKEKFV